MFVYSENRFVVLLVVLLLLLASAPLVDHFASRLHPILPHVLMGGFFFAMLLSAVYAVSDSRRTAVTATLLAVPTIAFWLIDLKFENDVVTQCQLAFAIVFVAYAIALILRHLFTADQATGNTVAASLCVYLLLGVLWAEVYSLLVVFEPGSFLITYLESDEPYFMRMGGRGASYALYYSFVTMTTLGYGDIVPVTLASRTFAYVQAVMGQMYLAVLVARLVGLHIAHQTTRRQAR